MHLPFLIGSTTYLRPVDKDDAPELATWINDPEVTRFLLMYRPLAVGQEEEFLKRIHASETELILGIVTRAEDQFIGVMGLHQMDQRNRHAQLGITIGDKNYWGKGHGTEAVRLLVEHAFLTLNFNRVWLRVVEFNARAIRSYEKVGFHVEGRLRQQMFRDGRYWDEIVMAILREDWEKGRAAG